MGPQKTPLKVVDVWKGQFSADGKTFAQSGRISLSNGATFGYRWIYRYEGKQLLARYSDTNNQGGLYLVTLGKEGKTLAVSPLAADKSARKSGLFSKVTLGKGEYAYLAEVREADGTAQVKTKVVCVPQVQGETEKKGPTKKPPAGPAEKK